MKYCMHCGKEVLDDAIICPGCGCSVQYGGASDNNFTKGNGNVNNSFQKGMPAYLDTYSPVSVIGFIFCFFSPVIGLILSLVAHSEAVKTGSSKSRSLAKAGIIVSAVFIGLVAFAVFMVLVLCFSVIW